MRCDVVHLIRRVIPLTLIGKTDDGLAIRAPIAPQRFARRHARPVTRRAFMYDGGAPIPVGESLGYLARRQITAAGLTCS